MSAAWTETRGPWTITYHYDHDAVNPREDYEHMFVFVGFPHRRYRIGDETLDPTSLELTCGICEGTGLDPLIEDEQVDCSFCEGHGGMEVRTAAMLRAWLQTERKARWIELVGMIDHSGVSYYMGGGAHWSDAQGWDSGTCGLMYVTDERLIEMGHNPDEVTPEQLHEWAKGELSEYSSWASGDCYGYVITHTDSGEELDSCWGFYGDDAVTEAAREACPETDEALRLEWASLII